MRGFILGLMIGVVSGVMLMSVLSISKECKCSNKELVKKQMKLDKFYISEKRIKQTYEKASE